MWVLQCTGGTGLRSYDWHKCSMCEICKVTWRKVEKQYIGVAKLQD